MNGRSNMWVWHNGRRWQQVIGLHHGCGCGWSLIILIVLLLSIVRGRRKRRSHLVATSIRRIIYKMKTQCDQLQTNYGKKLRLKIFVKCQKVVI
jgi:hypothetical protein